MDPRGRNDGVLEMKDARGVINGSGHDAGERQNGHMFTRAATIVRPRVPFLSADTFLTHEVRISALQSCRHDRLVVVNHDVVFGRSLDDLAVMAYTGLSFIPLQAIQGSDDRSHITGLDGPNAMSCVVTIDGVQVFLIIRRIAAGLVMTHYLHAETVSQTAQIIHIPIIIRSGKIEVFPVLPA